MREPCLASGPKSWCHGYFVSCYLLGQGTKVVLKIFKIFPPPCSSMQCYRLKIARTPRRSESRTEDEDRVSTGEREECGICLHHVPPAATPSPPSQAPKPPLCSEIPKDPPLGFVSPHHLLTLSTPCRRPNLSCHLSLRIIIITFTFTFTHKVEARAKLTVLPPNTIRKKT